MMDKLRQAAAQASNPGESEQVQALAAAVAGVERDLHGAIQDHYEAVGLPRPRDLPPAEERVEQLQALVSHQVEGTLWEFFAEYQAPDYLENLEAARSHAGKSPEQWEQTRDGWVNRLRDAGQGEGLADRELAGEFCRQRFGVDLEEFEELVVNYTDRRTVRWASRGPVDNDIRRIEMATEAITAVDPEGEPVETGAVEGDGDQEAGE